MGRKNRIWLENNFYHIICRGNRKEPLFLDEIDIRFFLGTIKKIHELTPLEICSYCLMTNHYHLLLRSKHISISKVMSIVNKKYANYFNKRYHLTGHVFEKRFFDNIIEYRTELLTVSRYIHLNPVKANIVNLPQNYPYSSMKEFYSSPEPQPSYPFIVTQPILDIFSGTTKEKQDKYLQWCLSK